MTISEPVSRSGGSRIRKVTFTHAASGTASENATTTDKLFGRLLRYTIDANGDAEWQFALNDGVVDIFASGNQANAAASTALSMHATVPHEGIPICGTLKCTTTNMSGTGVGPAITVYWEEDA